jgi:myo-inositol-1(or 4)-monophosphatase
MGSVAYKMARVAAGLADATWTLSPKHEWDVAAGTALVRAGGGRVTLPGGGPPSFNQAETLLPGLVATSASLALEVDAFLRRPAPTPGAPLESSRRR